jgi:hypothetical protein
MNLTFLLTEGEAPLPRKAARTKLERLRGSLSPAAFGGLEAQSQRRVGCGIAKASSSILMLLLISSKTQAALLIWLV